MPVCLEITDRSGSRELEVDADSFWIGGPRSQCEIELDLPTVCGRLLEVARDDRGRLRVRAEPGVPFPIRCATGTIGARFESFLDGDVLNVGPALVRLRFRAEPTGDAVVALDPGALAVAPGAPVGAWYRTFMEMADHLEGLKSHEQMVPAAMAEERSVRSTLATATAPSTLSRPVPCCSRLAPGSGWAVACRMPLTSGGVRPGLACSITAAAPATAGAAIEVPLRIICVSLRFAGTASGVTSCWA